MKLLLTVALALMAVGCGYSSQSNTPPAPGSTPVISGFVPATGTAGSAFMLEVDGNNFGSQATVNFNGASMAATWMNSGKLQLTVPAMAAGTVQVTVTNPGTTGGPYGGGIQPETSTAMPFTIN